MTNICNPIGIYFTPNNCLELSRYLKGNIGVLRNNVNLSLMLHSIYTYGDDIFPKMLYKGIMYRGMSSPIRLNSIQNVREMDWGSWSKSQDIAIDFAMKNEGHFKYLVARKGNAIDPAAIKDIAYTYFDENYHYCGLETYNPQREQEVIAPLIHNECSLIEIMG